MNSFKLYCENEKLFTPFNIKKRIADNIAAAKATLENYIANPEGSLNLAGYTNLTSLPDNLTRIDGDLNLRGLKSLTNIGGVKYIKYDLVVSGASNVDVPPDLYIGESIYGSASGLSNIPTGNLNYQTIRLNNCDRLTTIPEGIVCKDIFELSNCNNLKNLPKKLTAKYLDIQFCDFDLSMTVEDYNEFDVGTIKVNSTLYKRNRKQFEFLSRYMGVGIELAGY